MKHLVFIINPKSGVERNKKIQQAIDQYLDADVFTYTIKYTTHAGHGTQLAHEAAEANAFAVIAVGGDGSVNDIIKGIVGTNTKLGIIPKGSGNGLARTLNIPVDTIKAIQTINRCIVTPIDIGSVNGRLFASNAGVGFDALVCNSFAKSKRRGLAVYLWLITKHIFQFQTATYTIATPNKKIEEKAFMIAVANGQQLGYGFKIAPDANWTDGLLDVVIIKPFPFWMAPFLGYKMYRGTITSSKYITHFRTKSLTISSDDLDCLQTDGDGHPCENALIFTIHTQNLPTIVGSTF
jgi:diacylglycerol kinase (ATP)